MTVLKDDRVESEEKDLIAEAALGEEENPTEEKASGTAIASNAEMYFENNRFWS